MTSPNSTSVVLILDADSSAALACVQALGPRGVNLHLGLTNKRSLSAASKWALFIHIQPPPEDLVTALAWLSELDEKYLFTLIIPATEVSLHWLQQIPDEHPLRIKAQLASRLDVSIALNKSLTSELAAKLKIPVPKSRLIKRDDVAGRALSFPCILKPVNSKVVINGKLQSLMVILAKDEMSRVVVLKDWLPYTDVLEQMWMPGHGFGVELLFEKGKMLRSFVHERLHELPLTGGGSTLRQSIAPIHLWVDWSCRLLEELNWHGPAMVEWRVNESGEATFMEINPRFWGSLSLTIAAGVNMPLDLLMMAEGQSLEPQLPYKVGVIARNLEADLRWFIANLRANRNDPMLLTHFPLLSSLQMVRVLWGGEIWDGWNWRDLRVAFKDFRVVIDNIATSLLRFFMRLVRRQP